ncbi:MAG: ArsA family ATPase [Vicinamibacterales bacterium]
MLTPILDAITERRLIFVGGKGGVGKTTIASALGVMAADRGRRCLVVSTDPAHSLGDVFGRDIGREETVLTVGLTGLEIDPEREAEEHIAAVKHQMKELVHPRMYGEVERQLDLARFAPGTTEAALLERMAELMAEAGSRFDLVIFDTAPTGHTLRLLSLPEIMMAWTDGLLRHEARSSKLGSLVTRLGGAPRHGDDFGVIDTPADHEPGSRAARINEVLLTRQRKLRRARELLLDATATAFLLVLNPDRLSTLESRKAIESLRRASVPVAAVVVNRVLPAEAGGGEFLEARRRQEAPYLRQIEQEFAELPRVVLPLSKEDVHGVDALRRTGEQLIGGALP